MEKVVEKDQLMSGINVEGGINMYQTWRSQAMCKQIVTNYINSKARANYEIFVMSHKASLMLGIMSVFDDM